MSVRSSRGRSVPGSSSGGFEQITAQTRFQSVEICVCINKRVDVVCCSGSGVQRRELKARRRVSLSVALFGILLVHWPDKQD